jgi:DNA-binding transcriptional LysR family regulator
MLSLEQLSSLDLRAWLGSQQEAAAVIGLSQSQICRNGQQSLALLDELGFELGCPTRHLHCDAQGLLAKLRQLHQWMRFRDHCTLRLQASCWLRHLLLDPVPEGWVANRGAIDRFNDCEALVLLEHQVIDAALVSGPERPPADDPCLHSFVLSSQPLLLLVPEHHALARERGLGGADICGTSELAHSSFVHERCRQVMERLDQMLLGPQQTSKLRTLKREPPGHARRYGTAMTCLIRPDLVALDYGISHPALDVLVVRHEWIDHPAITALVQLLRQRLVALQPRIDGLELHQ